MGSTWLLACFGLDAKRLAIGSAFLCDPHLIFTCTLNPSDLLQTLEPVVLLQATGSLANLVPGSANIPLSGGSNTPVIANPNYVPPAKTVANNTDNNNNNNYQSVTGNNNIVVGKEVNTTVSQVQPLLPYVASLCY